MNDGFVVEGNDLGFVAFLLFAYGTDALVRVDFEDRGDPRHPTKVFHLDIESEGGKLLKQDYDEGQGVSNAVVFVEHYQFVSKLLRNMTRGGDTSWASPRWIAGRG